METFPSLDRQSFNEYLASTQSLYGKLAGHASFEPTDDLMQLYSSISKHCLVPATPAVEDQFFQDSRIQDLVPQLREKWGEAAGALEVSWAAKVLAANGAEEARATLSQYPRLQNYRSSCPLEMGLMTTVLGRFPTKLAMVGCGPLPLTGLSYVEHAHAVGQKLEVLNIDIVDERVQAARKLCSLVGKDEGMTFLTADGRGNLDELKACDVVVLASVAGVTDDDKLAMVQNIAKQMANGSLLLTRSSNRLSRLLYPRLDIGKLEREVSWIQPKLQAIALDSPTKHDIYVLRVDHGQSDIES